MPDPTHDPHPDIDPAIVAKALEFIAQGKNKRAMTVLRLLLKNGSVTTSEIQEEGYDHPPRAIGDVRDAGFPLVREFFTDAGGRRMGRFRFGRAADVRDGKFEGRTVIPRAFRNKLLEHYGAADRITGAAMPPTMLQVDHRIPFRVGGDAGLAEERVEDFMLLDASSQRSKSWACEGCRNFRELLKPAVCATCFWASPEAYEHVAMEVMRRTDILWRGDDVQAHDRLRKRAEAEGISMAEAVLRLVRESGA